MKTPIMLLLTADPALEDSVSRALLATDGLSHLTCTAEEAFQIVSSTGTEFDVAVIDCEHGPYGIRLVAAINRRREDLPIIVVTGDDQKCIEALAHANGAIACIAKPVSTGQIEAALKLCRCCDHELALGA